MTENLVIAFAGGGFGLLLAYWSIRFVRANLTFNEAISAVPLALDWNVLAFALLVSLCCAAMCGLVPAWKASRTEINLNLKEGGRADSSGRSQSRLRTVMVTGEIALAFFLLIGTGLLFRGLFRIEHQNLGFRPDRLFTASLTLDDARYKDVTQRSLFVRALLLRLEQIPGSEAVAVGSDLPATGPVA